MCHHNERFPVECSDLLQQAGEMLVGPTENLDKAVVTLKLHARSSSLARLLFWRWKKGLAVSSGPAALESCHHCMCWKSASPLSPLEMSSCDTFPPCFTLNYRTSDTTSNHMELGASPNQSNLASPGPLHVSEGWCELLSSRRDLPYRNWMSPFSQTF